MRAKIKFKEATVEEFIEAIRKLPYHSIREGWIHWLSDYNNPGMYHRKPDQDHSARYAYNHIVYPEMLLWLIRESGVSNELEKLAKSDSENFNVLRQQAAAIRKRIPWDVLEQALWIPEKVCSMRCGGPVRELRGVICADASILMDCSLEYCASEVIKPV